MAKAPKDQDESQLAKLTKSLLAMPQKLREDSKFGKPHGPKKKAGTKPKVDKSVVKRKKGDGTRGE